MLPTSKTPRSAAPEARSGQIHVSSQHPPAPQGATDGPRDPLSPIGPERLKALREAIRDGTYPSDEHVLGGLARMLGTTRRSS